MSKRNKRQVNKYFIILVLGFIGWIAETAYFGFNKTPENGLEGLLDAATALMMIYGVIGDLSRNVRITKSYHNVETHNIHTKKVEFTGDKPNVVTKQTVKVSDELAKRLKSSKPYEAKSL